MSVPFPFCSRTQDPGPWIQGSGSRALDSKALSRPCIRHHCLHLIFSGRRRIISMIFHQLYVCGECNAKITINDKGGSTTTPSRGTKRSACATPLHEPIPPARITSSPRPTTPKKFRQVMVCGRLYTTLGWFLGKANPSPRTVRSVIASCKANAVQLRNGDAKTLVAHGMARLAPDSDLSPDRCNFPSA